MVTYFLKKCSIFHHLAPNNDTIEIMVLIRYFLAVALLAFSLNAEVVAEIGKTKITLQDFQEYVDVQKFIANTKSFDALVKEKKTDKSKFLNNYLDRRILLLGAEGKGINVSTPFVEKKYQSEHLNWIRQIYVIKNVNLANSEITESDMKKIHKKYGNNDKSFKQLSREEKSRLVQFVLLDRFKIAKEKYKKKLARKYKVSKKRITAEVVAKVGNEQITQSDLRGLLEVELNKVQLNLEQVEKNNPKEYKRIAKNALEELIFNALVETEMKESNFLNQAIVKKVLASYKEQLAIEHFIIRELISRFEISPASLDNAFRELSGVNPNIKRLLPSEQERVLRRFILQRKQPEILSAYLNEKKEEILITKNKRLLDKII